MILWTILTAIFVITMLVGYVMSKVREEDINDDNTLSGMIMSVGCSGMAVFGMLLLMCILC